MSDAVAGGKISGCTMSYGILAASSGLMFGYDAGIWGLILLPLSLSLSPFSAPLPPSLSLNAVLLWFPPELQEG